MTFQTVEMENGYWLVFCVNTEEDVACCYSKTAAVGLVRCLNEKGEV